MAIKIDDDYITLLNKAVTMEITAIIQYMTQHSKASKIELQKKLSDLEVITAKNIYSVIGGKLKVTALQEMKHAEVIAERIYVIGGEATATALPPVIGDSIEDFLINDLKAESDTMELYRKIIKVATERGDITTKKLFEDIYMAEEEHYWMFDEYKKD
ncbi:MAG: ferritin [Candidatus Lokiarchaeota archaeon]|nr:ferritin [Candidatus Lokiarchaeota archaeon]